MCRGGRLLWLVRSALSWFCFFFFFQAEDGIRDYKVTGVQTCALPISQCGGVVLPGGIRELSRKWPSDFGGGKVSRRTACCRLARLHILFGGGSENSRSEERRVGKEGRSRWSPYH